jgi:hypothetical protein
MIFREYASLWGGPGDRENKDGSWTWTKQEAADLANALEQFNSILLFGTSMIEFEYDNGISGTLAKKKKSEDGLTPEQRKQQLIVFLRQGGFRWRFQSQEF